MTAGERLRLLAGVAGTAGTLLLLIGNGANTGAALVDYSKLATGTAEQHLLVDVSTVVVPITYGGGPANSFNDWVLKYQRPIERRVELARAPFNLSAKHKAEDEMILAFIINIVTQELLE